MPRPKTTISAFEHIKLARRLLMDAQTHIQAAITEKIDSDPTKASMIGDEYTVINYSAQKLRDIQASLVELD